MIPSLVNARIQVQKQKYYSYQKQISKWYGCMAQFLFVAPLSTALTEPQAKLSLYSRVGREVINILQILYL